MKHTTLTLIACCLLLIGVPARAATVELTLPSGTTGVQLISGGTAAVLDHLRSRLDAQLAELEKTYALETATQALTKADGELAAAREAHTNKVAELREAYASQVNITIEEATIHLSPESSALGEITFTYTATNTSDRIITDLIYLPSIGDIKLPTSSALTLELIDPQTLQLGLRPGGKLSNRGIEPERFDFFIGELKPEQIKNIDKDFSKKLTLHPIDLHFSRRTGYKGQIKEMGVEPAFAKTLEPYRQAIDAAGLRQESRRADLARRQTRHDEEKARVEDWYTAEAARLKNAAVRYDGTADAKGRCTLHNVSPGAYIVFARAARDRVIFLPVNVDTNRVRLDATTTRGNPFMP